MNPIQKSGFYYPNKFGLITLKALEDVMGKNGLNAILNLGGLNQYIDNFPADNLEKGFDFADLAGAGDLAFKVLPLQAKLRVGLPAMAKIFSQVSDQTSTVEERDNDFVYTIHRCPCCWGRSGVDKPVCFIAVGLLQEALKWVSGGNEFRVNESRCVAQGESVCEFIIQKESIG
jgi:hypothetical protein